MDELRKRREIFKQQVRRQKSYATTIRTEEMTVFEARSRLERLDESFNEFQQLQEQIDLDESNETMEVDSEERQALETDYFTTRSKFMEVLDKQYGNNVDMNATIQPQNMTMVVPSVKLPQLNLPTFNGDYADWLPFHDLYETTIHTNPTLSDVQKLQYLKGCLVGSASGIIQGIPTTNSNYQEAWKLIQTRYENKHVISQSHVRSIFEQPALSFGSSDGMRNLIDTTKQNLQALKSLGAPTDSWDMIIVYIVCEKLDFNSRREWEMNRSSMEVPTINELFEFLERRSQALKLTKPVNKGGQLNPKSSHGNSQKFHPYKHSASSYHVTSTAKTGGATLCPICSKNHKIYYCIQFCKLAVEERRRKVSQLRLCENCLQKNHIARDCKSRGCFKCGKKHHTSIHQQGYGFNKAGSSGGQRKDVNSLHLQADISHVILPTAVIRIDTPKRSHSARALLDSGSQASFITDKCFRKLKLQRIPSNIKIHGVGETTTDTLGKTTITIGSYVDLNFTLTLEVIIVAHLTRMLPSEDIPIQQFSNVDYSKLADPKFYKSRHIDILLGSDVLANLLKSKINVYGVLPGGQETVFGVAICGPVTTQAYSISLDPDSRSEQFDIKKFWEIEEIPTRSLFSQEEKDCEQHFKQAHRRDETGRFIVNLPFKQPTCELGSSIRPAVQRLYQVERRLEKFPERKAMYVKFMEEYLSLGHMKRIPDDQIVQEGSYYLPHHHVMKESSTTTKLRVVFDGSTITTSGKSLNNILMVGPTVQSDLWSILVRFRTHIVAFTADIEKMYRQIQMDKSDWDYQRIVWRSNPQDEIQHYWLTTVTYGTTSAPYLATKCLQQLAEDEAEKYSAASTIVQRDFYVDDLMSGAQTVHEGKMIQSETMKLLRAGGFDLRKWSSNCEEMLNSIPADYIESKTALQIDTDESIKTLGLSWHPKSDYFSFTVTISPEQDFTKRMVLSEISKVYDPLGWLSPIIIVVKILIQKMWLKSVSWDEQLDQSIQGQWRVFREKLKSIETIRIPRCLITQDSPDIIQLHGFSDASEAAYAACIYLRVEDKFTGEIKVNLVTSKSKVAPLKRVTLPRLELCGATLLTRLLKQTQEALHLDVSGLTAWTDSTIVLAWISGHPNKWKTYVGNRVAEIQDFISPENWKHVASEDNPADCASRGIHPDQLESHLLWWKGPSWLSEPRENWPTFHRNELPDVGLEQREIITMAVTTIKEDELLEKYSSLSHLLRITAYCIRFTRNVKVKYNRVSGPLTVTEINGALKRWISLVQRQHFEDEVQKLTKHQELSARSKIRTLHPFMDPEGLLRVGGRLANSNLPFDQKHPFLLPKLSRLTELVIQYEHRRLLHAGPQFLLSSLREKYWILGCRDLVRRFVHKCIRCYRLKAQTAQQLMGNLPTARVEAIRPFLKTGVDYAGPITIKTWKGRGAKYEKCYIALFICLATKAIHLELVSNLTTEGFLAALRRFVSRRGMVQELHSDCGSNFKGAEKELKVLLQTALGSKEELEKSLAMDNITWRFIPPASPHFGGLWEAGVKSTKAHMKRVIGNETLTFEELATLLAQVESCLNSRPLCPLSDDPSDLAVLTPGHFLVGGALVSVPEPDITSVPMNRLKRWQLIQQMMQHFWKRWQQEYLGRLQQRPKWLKARQNFQVGDMVLIKDENQPPLRWNMGRVVDIHPGEDGYVRVVTLKTSNGIFKRPITKLCRLPIEASDVGNVS